MRKPNRWKLALEKRRWRGRLGGLRSQRVQAADRAERGPDAETCRQHALEAQRGRVVAEGVADSGLGPRTHWCIVQARQGRRNQCELVIDGVFWARGSRRALERWAV